MMVYICPICNASLERARSSGKGYCPDCHSAYVLTRCMTTDRLVPADERARCLEASS